MMRPVSHPRRASTLILSLWALLLLSAVILAWAKWIDARMEEAHKANLALEARALAFSGLMIGLHPSTTPRTPALEETPEPGRSFHVTIRGEGGKLNLAYLLLEENPERIGILREYLTLRGLDLEEQQGFIDGLLDWVDPDNVRRMHGREEEPDYKPANKAITTLEEIPLVHGSGPLLDKHPGWRDDFTLLSRGPLDLKSAPEELIALIPGIGDLRAEQFVKLRQGADGEDETEDDPVFESMDQVIAALAMTREQFEAIRSLVSYDDPTVRIVSRGEAGEVHRQVEVVARRVGGSPPQMLMWIEN